MEGAGAALWHAATGGSILITCCRRTKARTSGSKRRDSGTAPNDLGLADPWLEPLYDDPRFQEIIRRMNLPSKSSQR